MKDTVYTIAQIVWGFPQTLAGYIVFRKYRTCPRFRYHGAIVTVWPYGGRGMALGPFVFLGKIGPAAPPTLVDSRLLVHEYGHTVQSLILGPLYLIVMGLPSAIWANSPALKRMRQKNQTSYYDFFPERFANWLGERVLHEQSMGRTFVD